MNKKSLIRLLVPTTALLISACASQTPATVVNGNNNGATPTYGVFNTTPSNPITLPNNPYNTNANNPYASYTPTVPAADTTVAPVNTAPAVNTVPPSSNTSTAFPVYTENSVALPNNTATPNTNSGNFAGYVPQNTPPSTIASNTPAATVNPNAATHRVEKGDTVFNIAKRYGISQEALIAQNNIQNNHIAIGQVLKIKGNKTTVAPISKPVNHQTISGSLTHRVEKGDTVFNIAQRYGISQDSLITQNGIQNNNIIIGQVLQIKGGKATPTPIAKPVNHQTVSGSSLTHRVEKGDTVFNIAKRYGISQEALITRNGIQNNNIAIGQILNIDGNVSSVPTIVPAQPSIPVVTSPTQPSSNNSSWIWPMPSSTINQSFAQTQRGTIFKGTANQNVQSTTDGKVIYIGVPEDKHKKLFGNQIIIVQHGENMVSLYGKVQNVMVAEGALVKRGQTLAQTGSDGTLHFEIRERANILDPNKFIH